MTTTTGSSANFRAPIGTNEALNNTFRAFAREATELAGLQQRFGEFGRRSGANARVAGQRTVSSKLSPDNAPAQVRLQPEALPVR